MDSRQQTLRMTGLPPATHREDIDNFFGDRINRKGRQIIENIGPICTDTTSDTENTTVTFSSRDAAQKALELEHARRRLTSHGVSGFVKLDHEFSDITTLHSSANPETDSPDIDIVAVHGLSGHAWNSFTASEVVDRQADRTRENNWLRDNLPKLLKQHPQQSIHARVMTFGYNADVWMTKSVADLDVPVNSLLWYLKVERQHAPQRPLFFIGHSLGGVVIKEAIVFLANEAIAQTFDARSPSQGKYIFPVKGCLFFGVPHKGADIADKASKFLNLLSKVFNVNKNNVLDLGAKSQRLANVSSQFRSVQSELDIPILSFYETVDYSHTLGLIVDKESAIFDYLEKPPPFGVNKNHIEMAKFLTDDNHALRPAIHFLADIARKAVALQNARTRSIALPLPPAPMDLEGHAAEDKFSILERYDTVFLIDDSPSMRGEKWELVQKILDYSTTMATHYDSDGIDIHFLNNFRFDQDNVRNPEIAVQIHHDVELRVLTDGEPNEEYENDSDISNHEDAKKNKAAFRLIRKNIVEVAKKLDHEDVEAERGQVGIQFCQIGNDHDATVFFQFLDDRLKGKHKLNRDMVDTIKCQSELDLTKDFFQKLLLGAIDKREDNTDLEAQASAQRALHPNLPHRSHPADRGDHRRFSEDDTIVGPSSSRWNSFRTNSSLRTLQEARITETPVSQDPVSFSSTVAHQRRSSPPLASQQLRQSTYQRASPETDREAYLPPRSSTFGSIRNSSRWKPFSK